MHVVITSPHVPPCSHHRSHTRSHHEPRVQPAQKPNAASTSLRSLRERRRKTVAHLELGAGGVGLRSARACVEGWKAHI